MRGDTPYHSIGGNVVFSASITASATLYPLSLADCLSRRTERSRGYLD
jgi:hypothetical protein